MKILFVCLGNICRSPMAETIMTSLLHSASIHSVEVDSAGLESYHRGDLADPRMRAHASRRGYAITHISRPLTTDDWDYFDMIVGMDDQNIRALRHRCPHPDFLSKITRATNFCSQFLLADQVPDPYYGGAEGFDHVIDLLEDSCQGILDYIQSHSPAIK